MSDQKKLNEERYKRCRENHLCLWCGKPLDREGSLCEACAEKSRQRTKTYKQYYLSMGICPTCRKRKVTPGFKSCVVCRDKKAMKRLAYKAEPEKQKEQSIKRKEIRAERIANGICVVCGKREAEKGFKTCPDCRKKSKQYRKLYVTKYQLSDRALWVSQGRCERCGSYDLQEGTKLCKTCYKNSIEALEKARSVVQKHRADARAAQEAAELQMSNELKIQFKPRTIWERKLQKLEREQRQTNE